MAYQYRRIRPSIIRKLWVYRRLVGSAVLLGLMLWFVWSNDTPVTVAFPFRLGHLNSALGVVILLSGIVGSLTTVLIMTVLWTARKIRGPQSHAGSASTNELAEDRPPADYAAKTTEGFPSAPWSR
jgi:uncharacterized integral membrane protein